MSCCILGPFSFVLQMGSCLHLKISRMTVSTDLGTVEAKQCSVLTTRTLWSNALRIYFYPACFFMGVVGRQKNKGEALVSSSILSILFARCAIILPRVFTRNK